MRTRQVLSDGWHVREVQAEGLDIAALTREAAGLAPGAAGLVPGAAGLARDGAAPPKPGDGWMPARMPAQVHDILLAHGRIPDPHVGKNAAASAWVGEKDWAYACRFESPPAGGGPVWLRFEGLDTLAAAHLNGRPIGRFDNMFREYAVDVRDALAPAGQPNVLLIVFSSALRFLAQVKPPPEHAGRIGKQKHLRKCHCDFGSYLGARPNSVKVGVHRDVVLDAADRAWIDDVWVRCDVADDLSRATVRATVTAGGEGAQLAWTLFGPDGNEVSRGNRPAACLGTEFEISVADPKLWWPWTHGTPHLYRLRVALAVDGREVDRREAAVGLRHIRPVLSEPATGEKRFAFEVNGRRVFLKGANWVPPEGATHCWRPERAMRLLDLARHGRMNVLRVWGEGYVPPQAFYDECDRRGILIWQDFMFGYGMHPSDVPAFAESCRAEIEEMVRRLRSHACLLLWCGGNENYMGWDFAYGGEPTLGRELFETIMPEACGRLDPGRLFHRSSPYGGPRPNWPLEGAWHDYTTRTFSPEASVPLCASEGGRVSAPSAAAMRRFMSEEELWPAGHEAAIRTPGKPSWPPMWQYRSVDGSWDKIGPIEEFCDPASAEDLIRVLGTAHGEYLQRRVERERRGTPDGGPDGARRCWGNIVWRLNDAWPILYWSVIDYSLEPKIAYYFLRRAYAPVLVCFEKTADRIAAWVVNDSTEKAAGTLEVSRRRFDGKVLGKRQADVAVDPGEARRCLDLTDLGPINLRGEFLHATFAGHEATCLLAGERYLHLPKARLAARKAGQGIEVSTDAFARQVSLEVGGGAEAFIDENFFDLPPGQARTVRITGDAKAREVAIRAVNADAIKVSL